MDTRVSWVSMVVAARHAGTIVRTLGLPGESEGTVLLGRYYTHS
jgi:hypothetical protein